MQMFVKKVVFLLVCIALHFLVARNLLYRNEKEKQTDLVVRLDDYNGHVMEEGMLMMEQNTATDEEEEETTTTKFSSKTQFDVEVKDGNSIWLIQVIQRNSDPLLTKKTRSTVVKELSCFGIRHGIFDCSIDARFCAQKNWHQSCLLLAIPQDQVPMPSYTSAIKAQQIIDWVYSQLSDKVHYQNIGPYFNWDELGSQHDVALKIVLFSKFHESPDFFSALSFKYSGRVKFVLAYVKGSQLIDKQRRGYRFPSYAIVTPNGKKTLVETYDKYSTCSALDTLLQTFSPKSNGIFNLCFILVIVVCFTGVCVIEGGIAKRICGFLWTIAICITVSLPFITQLPSSVQYYLYKMTWLFSQTWLMGKVRQDGATFSGHSYIMILSSLLYCVAVLWVYKKMHAPTSVDSMMRASSPVFRNGPPQRDHREEGLALLFEPRLFGQMASPDPLINENSINQHQPWFDQQIGSRLFGQMATPDPLIRENHNRLLTWRYRSQSSHSSGNENDSSDSESGFTVCRPHKKKRKLQQRKENSIDRSESQLETNREKKSMSPLSDPWPEEALHSAECTICKEPYKHEDELRALPCGHAYHKRCIDKWIVNYNKKYCPLCRRCFPSTMKL